MAKSKHYYIRRTHRYLGLVLGIQFLMWTLGGLYFSWSNMDEIHGDFQRKPARPMAMQSGLVSPSMVFDSIRQRGLADSLVSVQLIEIMGRPVYQVRASHSGHQQAGHHEMAHVALLLDATTGHLRGPLSKEEATSIAKLHFNGQPRVRSVEYLTQAGKHHEYRENPLPAYAVEFDHPSGTVVYVASELGTVQKFRNQKWRVFDFLWMLHTMDYESRDHFGNLLLRAFSIFGLFTVLSGFLLYFISSRWYRKMRHRSQTHRSVK